MNVFYSYLFISCYFFSFHSRFFPLFFFFLFCATRHRRLRWVSLSCLAIVSCVLSECESVCVCVRVNEPVCECMCMSVPIVFMWNKQFLRASLKFLETRPLRMFSNYKQFQCSSSASGKLLLLLLLFFIVFVYCFVFVIVFFCIAKQKLHPVHSQLSQGKRAQWVKRVNQNNYREIGIELIETKTQLNSTCIINVNWARVAFPFLHTHTQTLTRTLLHCAVAIDDSVSLLLLLLLQLLSAFGNLLVIIAHAQSNVN